MLYPEGYIVTNIISNIDGICTMQAEVGYYVQHNTIAEDMKDRKYQDTYLEKVVLATGTAYEKEDSTFINKTSYIENCETSAVGRALGMCGIGIDTSVRSAEEVANATINQLKEEVIDDIKAKALGQAIENNKLDKKRVQGVLASHGYALITEIKTKDFKKIADELAKLKED